MRHHFTLLGFTFNKGAAGQRRPLPRRLVLAVIRRP
jgi:hypothetical protein